MNPFKKEIHWDKFSTLTHIYKKVDLQNIVSPTLIITAKLGEIITVNSKERFLITKTIIIEERLDLGNIINIFLLKTSHNTAQFSFEDRELYAALFAG